MVADARPLVHDEHARALARHGVVIGLPAFAEDIAGLILKGLLDDGRVERAEGAKNSKKGGQQGFHAC